MQLISGPSLELGSSTASSGIAFTCFSRRSPSHKLSEQERNVIFAGTDVGSVFAWDMRADRTRPILQIELGGDTEITAMTSLKTYTMGHVVAQGSQLFLVDGRNASAIPLIDKDGAEFPDDVEVNALAFSSNGSHLAAINDDGFLETYDTSRLSADSLKIPLRQRCQGQMHANVGMDVAFRTTSSSECFSIGLDAKLKQWDIHRGRLLDEIDFMRDTVSNTTSSQMVNPPMAYSMAVRSGDDVTAVGLGDGRIQVFRRQNGVQRISQWSTTCLEGGHYHAVARVCFGSEQGTDKLLFSGGLDGRINVWNMDFASQAGSNVSIGHAQLADGCQVNDILCCDRQLFVIDQCSPRIHCYQLQQ